MQTKDHADYYPGKRQMAMFLDVDNFSHDEKTGGVLKLLMGALRPWGDVVLRRAYGIMLRSKPRFCQELRDNKFSLVNIAPFKKGSTDVRIAMDITQVLYAHESIQTFVLASGDGDFSDIVDFLHQQDRKAIGIGYRRSSSSRLKKTCDAFLFYDDILAAARAPRHNHHVSACTSAMRVTQESLRALLRKRRLCPPDPPDRKKVLSALAMLSPSLGPEETVAALLDKLYPICLAHGINRTPTRNVVHALVQAGMIAERSEAPFYQKRVLLVPSVQEMENAIGELQLEVLLEDACVVADPFTLSEVIWGNTGHAAAVEKFLEDHLPPSAERVMKAR